jgi:hypothetical protein
MRRLDKFFAFAIVAGIIFFTSCKQSKVKTPDRLRNIPQEAKWIGGVDGGSWYQVSEVLSDNAFKIKIYNDGNGELEVDTIFILNPNCALKKIDTSKLMKSIDGFDGEKILLNIENKRCSLTMK